MRTAFACLEEGAPDILTPPCIPLSTMSDYPDTAQLTSVTIILPVMNETVSLRQTVEVILRDTPKECIQELLIVVCQKTTEEAMAAIAGLQKQQGALVVVLHQQQPFLGGAVREAFDRARGSHVIMMASDLETDPKDVRGLIEEARKNPGGIVTASRWQHAGQFQGYSKVKLVCNWLFQRFFSVLYGTQLTDMTFAYRIFPTKLVQAIQWEELRHPFLFETLVKPLRLGVRVTEIPSVWRARTEGESQNAFFRNFAYFKTGLRARFIPRRFILKSTL
jgi:glycosyltransferase involved in cell wall biosynthesis